MKRNLCILKRPHLARDTQFAATPDEKLDALVSSIEAEINRGETLPMFDERGEFVEPN